jgi:hypothetical protein
MQYSGPGSWARESTHAIGVNTAEKAEVIPVPDRYRARKIPVVMVKIVPEL